MFLEEPNPSLYKDRSKNTQSLHKKLTKGPFPITYSSAYSEDMKSQLLENSKLMPKDALQKRYKVSL